MPSLRTIATRLFALPAGPPSESYLLSRAATAHQHLLDQECQKNPALCEALPALRARPRSGDNFRDRVRLFCHPALVEGLHRLSPTCPRLKAWHDAVASPCILDVAPETCEDFGCLGTIEFVLRMHDRCQWTGPLRITSDALGRMRFPFCDWGINLRTGDAGSDCVLADEAIDVTADPHLIRWQWTGDDAPFLIMPREICRQMVVGNPTGMATTGWECESKRIVPTFGRASPLCETGVRYEPIHIPDAANAEETAAIERFLHEAMRRNSPPMHHEFCSYMSSIRGFELHLRTRGIVHSFSDPTLPGVMSLNVPYTERHEPRLSPLCFTWLAHELAHTKFYLINDIAFDHGWTFVRNAEEMTDEVERYERRLPIRTLFQIPYTHIYEWESLMDFLETDFDGLPWQVDEDPIAYGEDLKSEIEEALALTDKVADLTSLGTEAFSRFSELYAQSSLRWKAMTAA